MRKRDLFRTGTAAPAAIVLFLAVGIAFELVRHSRLSIEKFGLRFWSGKVWDPVSGEFGAFPFLWGTLYSSILALAIAAPISIGIAVFLSELSPGRLRRPLVFLTELLAAIPSIVYGLWGNFVLVPLVRRLETAMPPDLRKLPFFTGPPLGVGMLAAALILAIMVIPFASAVAREVVRAVPAAQREAAYALGATRFEAIRAALFHGRTGIAGALLLGFGRALGETMAVTMVIGNNPRFSLSLFAPQHTMAAVIANEFTEAADDLYLNALMEIGLVLFVVTLVVNGLSRLLIWGLERKNRPRSEPAAEPVVAAAEAA
ncbi:MAG TPA: phosphate ABC transporter permease subunit PstC [Thermoanaerobaculia bacterium]|nr:phosphate ABC transporter permease subunit PstC [Thermoanaerobaculia bacterium]